MKNIIIPAAACFLAAAPFARAASIYTETFSNDGNVEGWFEVTDATSSTFGQSSGALSFGGLGYGVFYAAADAASSGGAFSGNYAAALIQGVTFQAQINPGSTVNGLFLELANITSGVTFQYALAPAFGLVEDYEVYFASPGWTQTTGVPVAFNSFLTGVEELSIAFTGDGSGNLQATLDNVSTVPEPSALLLSAVGLLGLLRRKR